MVGVSDPYATCALTGSLVLHSIVALNGVRSTVRTSLIVIGVVLRTGGAGGAGEALEPVGAEDDGGASFVPVERVVSVVVVRRRGRPGFVAAKAKGVDAPPGALDVVVDDRGLK
jgi:hypothetical protein